MDIISRWHRFVETRDMAMLHDLLDRDAVFESPVVHAPQHGHALVMQYLAGAMTVLGNEAFRYTGEWRSESGAVLEFETEIEGVAINGVDIIRFTADGLRIARFKVMVRPLKAINLVHRLMAETLARRAPARPA